MYYRGRICMPNTKQPSRIPPLRRKLRFHPKKALRFSLRRSQREVLQEMAPIKKAPAGGSKKSNQIKQQPSQKPSKFGIQHFFERHTQNCVPHHPQKQPAIAKEFSVDVGSVPERPLDPVASTRTGVVVRQQSDRSFSTGINPRKDLGLGNANNNGDKNPYQRLTPVARDDATGNQLEVSPEFCKSVSRKRIKFSPGMVSLGPLMFALMFVLVGDHYQLPPLVQSTEARENGMGVSLFCRLSEAHPQSISALQSQYCMCAPIMELFNALIYANAKLEYISSTSLPSWLKKGEDIGVITSYNSQANLIKQHVTQSLEIHTIEKYQILDFKVLIFAGGGGSQRR
ncbi:Dna2 [Cynara cardunculus var. scolymus]|uniref:DNA replication ATP-dependent helicase/nuclease n=1 Tax=Cynara cardunculus var. scolymus TaxID=59895 RepID=A0A103YF89_CYNCS|nr:Dna2 [Cynara cardunculus var. scolymus]